MPKNVSMLATAWAWCSSRRSYDTTCPSVPAARQSAIVSAPEPVPASTTRAPGKTSAEVTIGPRSFG